MEASILMRCTIENLYRKHETGVLRDDYCLQRDEGQWTVTQKNALIDSMFKGFIIPQIWVVKDGKYLTDLMIIDGRQRTSTIFTYMNDEWKLAKSFEPVYYKEKFYNVAGKKFSELDEEMKQLIRDFSIEVVAISEYTEEELEEQFLRLNSGTSFKATQKMRVALGTQIAPKFDEKILNLGFWDRCVNSIANDKTDCRLGIALECLMLLTDFECNGNGSPEIMKFANYYKDNYKDSDLDELAMLLDKLDEYYPADKECEGYLKKINIPALVMCMKLYLDIENGKKLFNNKVKCRFNGEEFEKWLYTWVTKTSLREYVPNACHEGTTKKYKVEMRVNLICQSLINNVEGYMYDLIEEIKGEDFDYENGDYSFLDELDNDDQFDENEVVQAEFVGVFGQDNIVSDIDNTVNDTDDTVSNTNNAIIVTKFVGDDDSVQDDGQNGVGVIESIN